MKTMKKMLAIALLATMATVQLPALGWAELATVETPTKELGKLGNDEVEKEKKIRKTDAEESEVSKEKEKKDFNYVLERISGKSRVDTSVEIAKTVGFPVEKIFIASGLNYADALSAGSLTNGEYPILLYQEGAELMTTVKESGAKEVVLVGGESVIPTSLEDEFKASGFEVTRLSGADRYATNRAVLAENDERNIIVASGENFPDALAAGALLEQEDAKLLLANSGTIPEETIQLLQSTGVDKITVVGGEKSVSDAYVESLKTLSTNIERIYGENRYATAMALADRANNAKNLVIASGENFPDALSATALAQKYDAAIILTEKVLTPVTRDYLYEKAYTGAYVVGGENSIGAELFDLIAKLSVPLGLEQDLSNRNLYRYPKVDMPLLQEANDDAVVLKMIPARHIVKVVGVCGEYLKVNDYGVEGYVKMGEKALRFYEKKDFGAVRIEIPQYESQTKIKAWWGCVPTSLYMGMVNKGYTGDVTLEAFLRGMPTHPSNPDKGFSGSVWEGSKTVKIHISAAKLTEYANTLEAATGHVVDLQTTDFDDVIREIQNQNPVVLNLTLRWEDPKYRDYPVEGEMKRMVENNHASLFNGYDPNTNTLHCVDPFNYKTNTYGGKTGVMGERLEFDLPLNRVVELFAHDSFAISIR